MTDIDIDALPDGEGEAIGMEAEFTGGFDEDSGEYQVALQVPGLRVLVNVHPSGFDYLDVVLPSLPNAVTEVIEAIVEAREGATVKPTIIAEETL